MLLKLKNYFNVSRRQFFFYFVVGFSGTVLDLLTLILFKEVFGWRPVMAVIVNQAIILNYVFFLNKFVTFRARGSTLKRWRNFVLLAIWNYTFAVGWMYFLNERSGYNYLLTRVSGIILAVSWNFLLYKYWVYKPLEN